MQIVINCAVKYLENGCYKLTELIRKTQQIFQAVNKKWKCLQYFDDFIPFDLLTFTVFFFRVEN